nr:hypothetical protein [Paenibacillus ginsengihumi]
MDENGKVLAAKELTGVGVVDPKRIATLVDEVMAHIREGDIVAIEGFGFSSQQAIMLGWIGGCIRDRLYRCGIPYTEVSPSQVKKFATGKGNAKKDEMVLPIYRKWGFEHGSDNVRDAYVLAQIARATQVVVRLTKEQAEVVQSILNPPEKKPKRKKVAR